MSIDINEVLAYFRSEDFEASFERDEASGEVRFTSP